MKSFRPSRLPFSTAIFALLAVGTLCAPGFAQKQPLRNRAEQRAENRAQAREMQPAPMIRPTPPPNASVGAPQREPHLQKWMQSHSNLSLPEQQRALQNEPGFRQLPPQVQQRELDQLQRLNTMSPQQRSRMLDRNEQLERMSPAQRQQWRSAVQDLDSLPVPRRRLMARAILDLREMSPEQRQQVLNSPQMRTQFSDGERSTLSTLLSAEPYNPAQ